MVLTCGYSRIDSSLERSGAFKVRAVAVRIRSAGSLSNSPGNAQDSTAILAVISIIRIPALSTAAAIQVSGSVCNVIRPLEESIANSHREIELMAHLPGGVFSIVSIAAGESLSGELTAQIHTCVSRIIILPGSPPSPWGRMPAVSNLRSPLIRRPRRRAADFSSQHFPSEQFWLPASHAW